MRRMPYNASIFDKHCLGGFVTNSKALRDRLGQPAAFDNKNDGGFKVRIVFGEVPEVLVDVSADRTLRAMLENENGIGFGALQKLFQILVLS